MEKKSDIVFLQNVCFRVAFIFGDPDGIIAQESQFTEFPYNKTSIYSSLSTGMSPCKPILKHVRSMCQTYQTWKQTDCRTGYFKKLPVLPAS